MASAKNRLSASLHWHRGAGESREKANRAGSAETSVGETDRRFLMNYSGSMLASNGADKALEMKGNKEDPQSSGPVPPPILRGC